MAEIPSTHAIRYVREDKVKPFLEQYVIPHRARFFIKGQKIPNILIEDRGIAEPFASRFRWDGQQMAVGVDDIEEIQFLMWRSDVRMNGARMRIEFPGPRSGQMNLQDMVLPFDDAEIKNYESLTIAKKERDTVQKKERQKPVASSQPTLFDKPEGDTAAQPQPGVQGVSGDLPPVIPSATVEKKKPGRKKASPEVKSQTPVPEKASEPSKEKEQDKTPILKGLPERTSTTIKVDPIELPGAGMARKVAIDMVLRKAQKYDELMAIFQAFEQSGRQAIDTLGEEVHIGIDPHMEWDLGQGQMVFGKGQPPTMVYPDAKIKIKRVEFLMKVSATDYKQFQFEFLA